MTRRGKAGLIRLLAPMLLLVLAACDSTSFAGAGNNEGARGRVSLSLPL